MHYRNKQTKDIDNVCPNECCKGGLAVLTEQGISSDGCTALGRIRRKDEASIYRKDTKWVDMRVVDA